MQERLVNNIKGLLFQAANVGVICYMVNANWYTVLYNNIFLVLQGMSFIPRLMILKFYGSSKLF